MVYRVWGTMKQALGAASCTIDVAPSTLEQPSCMWKTDPLCDQTSHKPCIPAFGRGRGVWLTFSLCKRRGMGCSKRARNLPRYQY